MPGGLRAQDLDRQVSRLIRRGDVARALEEIEQRHSQVLAWQRALAQISAPTGEEGPRARYMQRQFEIIGESLAQLRTVDADTAASVPELARIVAFRNLLIHGYATVDDKIVWGVVEGSLPQLREALRRLLAAYD